MGKFLDILKKLGDLSVEIDDYQLMTDRTDPIDLQEKAKREKQEEIDFFNNAMRKNSQNMKSLTDKESGIANVSEGNEDNNKKSSSKLEPIDFSKIDFNHDGKPDIEQNIEEVMKVDVKEGANICQKNHLEVDL